MRTKINEFNDDYVSVQFFPTTEQEKNILTAFRNNNSNVELTVTGWTENAILNEASDNIQ